MNIALGPVDFAALSPFLVLLAAAVLLLLLESFASDLAKKWALPLTLVSIALAMAAVVYVPASTNPLLTPWLKFDSLTYLFNLLFLSIGFGSALLSGTFLKRHPVSRGEYYFLLLAALFGLMLIIAAADFLTLFLGLETLSIALYVLCGYIKHREVSHEASMKYFLIGAVAAAFLLYGIALIYGAVGTTGLNGLLDSYRALGESSDKVLFFAGIALVTMGLAFKAAVVPFHVWAPDVYEGAPTPVTAFMAIGTKAGAFAAFIRVFWGALPQFSVFWSQLIAVLACLTLVYANIVALRQFQLKRFFAYSGIAHAGFLLMPLVAGTVDTADAMLFYLAVYSLATFGAFAVITLVDGQNAGSLFRDLQGLFYRSPALAVVFAICLLTLAGIPPTAGFFAKFYVFKVTFQAGYYWLVVVGLLTTIFSAYYYLRIMGLMFAEAPGQVVTPLFSWKAGTVAVAALLGILMLSVFPAPLMTWLAVTLK
jgi:NADH-quinone oxidoreductase subunit N